MIDDINTSATLSLEEEMQEGYEPTQQEIIEYALHLGMDLQKDQRYFDIARAGLKAPIPPEWKPCQKTKNGQQDFFYKNQRTGEVSYEHPCDLIYRKRFEDAKILDSKKTTKKSGINKFKAAIEQQRDEDVLQNQEDVVQKVQQNKKPSIGKNKFETNREFGNELPEERSILIESQVNQRQKTNEIIPGLGENISMQQSMLQEQIIQEINQKIREYEKEKQQTFSEFQKEFQIKLEQQEQKFINDMSPELTNIKRQYTQQQEAQKERFEIEKTRRKRRVEEEVEEEIVLEEEKIKNKSDQELRTAEDFHDKKLKNQLKQFEADLKYQNIDLKKKIEYKKKQNEDADRKIQRELDEKKRRVQDQFEVQKYKIKDENTKKKNQVEQELLQSFKNQRDQFIRNFKEHSSQEINSTQQQTNQLKVTMDQLTSEIDEDFRIQKQQQMIQIQRQMKQRLEEYEVQEKIKIEKQIKDLKEASPDLIKERALEDINRQREQLISQYQIDLKNYETEKRSQLDRQKEELHEVKKKRFQKIKDRYPNTGNEQQMQNEIELFMEADQVRMDIEITQDQIKRLQRNKESLRERLDQLIQVCNKFELGREANSSELVKYELEHKQFLVQKQKDKLQLKILEIDALIKELEANEQKASLAQYTIQTERGQSKQIDQVMQSVSQLKDILTNVSQQRLPIIDEKVSQSQFMKESTVTKFYKNKSSIAPPTTDYVKEFRKWQGKIVEERVRLNKQKEDCGSNKLALKQMQNRLLKEQASLKNEIKQTVMSYHQPNQVKKDLLKKMKIDIQTKLQQLSQQIIKLNTARSLLRQKEQTLSKIENILDICADDSDSQNKYPKCVEAIQNLYDLYINMNDYAPDSPMDVEMDQSINIRAASHSVGDFKMKDDVDSLSVDEMEDREENFITQQELKPPPNLKERVHRTNQAYHIIPPQESNRYVTFNAYETQTVNQIKKQTAGLRSQLVGHRDWLQNFKYQLNKNVSRSPESRRQLNNYSNQLLNY